MNKGERQLLELYEGLNGTAQGMLRNYAEFLSAQPDNVKHKDTVPQQPKDILAAENESVVGAIKRLSERYFMLDKAKLLNSASTLMAQHVMQGREAVEVITELEESFASAYGVYCHSIENNEFENN